jgi:hypothetical protein
MPGVNDSQVLHFYNEHRPMVFSDMFSLYLDYPHAVTPLKRVYEYAPVISGEVCDASSVYGLEACLWAERVDTNEKLEKLLFPRIFALAENAWSHEKDFKAFSAVFQQWAKKLSKSGMTYTPPDEANPEGEARMKTLFETLGSFNVPGEPDDNRIDPSEMFSGGDGNPDDFAKIFMTGFGIDPAILAAKR